MNKGLFSSATEPKSQEGEISSEPLNWNILRTVLKSGVGFCCVFCHFYLLVGFFFLIENNF